MGEMFWVAMAFTIMSSFLSVVANWFCTPPLVFTWYSFTLYSLPPHGWELLGVLTQCLKELHGFLTALFHKQTSTSWINNTFISVISNLHKKLVPNHLEICCDVDTWEVTHWNAPMLQRKGLHLYAKMFESPSKLPCLLSREKILK